jgi:hypothetical protein
MTIKSGHILTLNSPCSVDWADVCPYPLCVKSACMQAGRRQYVDVPTSPSGSGTNHDHDQPSHLAIKSLGAATAVSMGIFGDLRFGTAPQAKFGPTGMYFANCQLQDTWQPYSPVCNCPD